MSATNIQIQSFDELHTLDEKFQYAQHLFPLGKYEDALIYFRILKETYEEQQNYVRVMDCLGCIIQCLGNSGKTEELFNYLSNYKMYCDLYGDAVNKLKLHVYLGFANSKLKSYEEAVAHYLQAKELAVQQNDQKRLTSILINLLSCYIMLQEHSRAMQAAEEIAMRYQQLPQTFSKNAYVAFLLNFAMLLLEQHRLEEVSEVLIHFEEVVEGLKLKREMTFYHYIKGRYFLIEGRYAEASSMLHTAYYAIIETKELPTYHLILSSLIELYEQQKMFEKALFFAKELNESFANRERLEQFEITQKISKQFNLDDMRELAYKDALTGVHNRRYLEKKGEELVLEALAEHTPLYCVVFDIDNFKLINDRYGHLMGDKMIKILAQKVSEIIGYEAVFTRYGGDEFVLLYTNVTNPTVYFYELFLRISTAIAELAETKLQFTISMGVTSLSSCEEKTLHGMIGRADANLYCSKEDGKNTVTITI